MIFRLSEKERTLLKNKEIPFAAAKDYDDDAALELLDMVREAQVAYAQNEDESGKQLYAEFERLADKIYAAIPM